MQKKSSKIKKSLLLAFETEKEPFSERRRGTFFRHSHCSPLIFIFTFAPLITTSMATVRVQALMFAVIHLMSCEAFVSSKPGATTAFLYHGQALFHQSSVSEYDETDFPEWASDVAPPEEDGELEILYVGTDDFASFELENGNATPETFCATVVYEEKDAEPRFFVEPRMGTIEPNGGSLEVTVKHIEDEDADGDSLQEVPDAWLVISTEKERWHYKLEDLVTTEDVNL